MVVSAWRSLKFRDVASNRTNHLHILFRRAELRKFSSAICSSSPDLHVDLQKIVNRNTLEFENGWFLVDFAAADNTGNPHLWLKRLILVRKTRNIQYDGYFTGIKYASRHVRTLEDSRNPIIPETSAQHHYTLGIRPHSSKPLCMRPRTVRQVRYLYL